MSRIAPLPERAPIRFRIDDDEFELPEIDTRTWLDTLTYQSPACWWRIIPGQLTHDEARRLIERMSDPDDPLDIDHLEKYALQVIERRLGVELFPAQRLVLYLRANWLMFDGWMVEHSGHDPLQLPIDRLIAAAYNLRMQGCEKDSDRAKARAQIYAPPEGTRASGRRWDEDPDYTRTIDELHSNWFMQALPMARQRTPAAPARPAVT